MASEICSVENVRQRGALIEKFIEVAKVQRCWMNDSLYWKTSLNREILVMNCCTPPLERAKQHGEMPLPIFSPGIELLQIILFMYPSLQHCHEYKNFNTTISVVSGLSLAAVRRLKRSWEVCRCDPPSTVVFNQPKTSRG